MNWFSLIEAVYFVVYMLIALYSSCVAIVALRKPGISSDARKMIFRRHVSYIAVNILCQSYNIFGQVVIRFA